MGNIIFNNIKLGKKGNGLNIDSLTLPLENIIAVVGSKGGGKTDFINLVAGKLHPQGGSVEYDEGALVKGDLFVVDSKTYLNAYLTVKELIDKTEKEYPNFDRDIAVRYLNEMQIPMDKTNYRNFDRRAQCAINCILAIASRARVTIFDQPCRDMNLKLRDMLYKFAKEDYLLSPRTIVITSNIAVDIDQVATYVVYLRKNKVVFSMPYEEVDKYAVGLLGKEEVIDKYIGGLEVFYECDKNDGLKQKIVRNNMPFENVQALALEGVISQYVNLVNFHTYVVKEDFGFNEKQKLKAEAEKLAEKREAKKAKKANKNAQNMPLLAKDETQTVVDNKAVEEKKETFGEKLKRILTSDIF